MVKGKKELKYSSNVHINPLTLPLSSGILLSTKQRNKRKAHHNESSHQSHNHDRRHCSFLHRSRLSTRQYDTQSKRSWL